MATTVARNGNGPSTNGTTVGITPTSRFSDIPAAIDIPVSGGLDADEAVEVNLEDHLDDPTELCQLLENEKAAKNLWITIALAYAKQAQIDHAVEILGKGLGSLSRSGPKERLSLLTCVAWLNLLKSREAPRVLSEIQQSTDTKTKDTYLREATATINDALRINPAFPPLYLTRGVLFLLRASLLASTKTGPGADAERAESLKQASKCFDDALRSSDGRNMMAAMGKARTLYLLKQYGAALQTYQEVLSKMPGLTDPDPRIGIGCCLWQLGFPERAKSAWERSLALNPNSKVANALLGVFYLHESAKYPASDPQFNILYKKAMIDHTKKAYTIDKNFPLSCATFASYFLLTGRYDTVEPLARKAIEQTDINAIASEGWYLLARKEHNKGDLAKANDCYSRADQARGGLDRGYFPAKYGLIQIMVQSQDIQGAKFRLESLGQLNRHVEAMTLLGCIYAEEAFSRQSTLTKEDKGASARKAVTLLENVRRTWKDEKSRTKPDESVLLYLARLYEHENPIESLKCVQQVEAMQLEKIPDEDKPDPSEDNAAYIAQLREHLPPQLLNNMACFLYGQESYTLARETFQIALNACVKLTEKQEAEKEALEGGKINSEDVDNSDTDALVTTISYNLARTYEALGLVTEAQKVYEGLLARHADYTDASARLAYIALETSPREDGPRKIHAVYQSDYGNTEVRALMGWYHHSAKKKTNNIAEDAENRHYKHTLQGYDKHDLYSLTGMGNVHLNIARDMPRNTDQEKEKRSKMYAKAYEFFDKALQLDPKNAYAAQGVAIALCDDKKAYSDALQVFTKIKDTLRDASVNINLGHVMTELRQYQRSIDNYEIALRKEGKGENAQLLACLSRSWLLKGKSDRSIPALNTALDYMKRALATQADSPHLQFNVAFIQFQIAQHVNQAKETDRTLEDVDAAITGLEEAIETFEQVAKHKQPPYPRSALEQRAAMGKNTMRNQLERQRGKQAAYETENATKLQEAKEKRQEELRRREEAARRRREEEEERAKKIADERRRIVEETEKLAEHLRAEAAAREAAEYTDDEETGDRVKRKAKKGGSKRKKRDDEDGFIEDDGDQFDGKSERSVSRTPISGSDNEGAAEKPKKKRRKLERKNKPVREAKKNDKYKSAAVVVDSDSELEEEPEAVATPGEGAESPAPFAGDQDEEMADTRDEDDDEVQPRQPARQRKQLRTIADDDEDEDEDEVGANGHAETSEASKPSGTVNGDDDEDDE
ncbi:protein required for normal CLN1 and CLN2 G1 cyclin expression [Elasticomyces elasticus]|uniref:Protein required for normal CLN1 and CLN2 G1 cyclin expression n=1 Tax=Exophiala sideris TaxID=1016849 RepID=A0ABR0J7K7_9EURO|nr:protein required for normal CLN1 and CLN2 G1 cyclin expression [Elasticomyces elasticus]KAK5029412.1 protein required for normal CLN1 and CLN2 G1 cyclin expression [Exophiala sideris]KAK5036890.1 protein required for normal CLN1 and CLN2 G1 cyclin expression [Exophiala sideris]KAK5058042.1 protein required for normal CLN1 and CLN2 G1 cyclin expression [Exophiala sideris]KAK5182001.1 protein required for normal CLN1 and CLN2 G1 cyclin expression [Eurotiomycetes sp. CCFEE 6388]